MNRLHSEIHAHVQHLLLTAPIAAAYRTALTTALAAPGQILSGTPVLRWARLLWTCCAAAGGDVRQALAGAASVELFMTALNMLDDVEDGEASPPQAELGPACALNASTGLLLLGQWALLQTPRGDEAARILISAGLTACSGQHSDLDADSQHLTDLETALAVTRQKSASLVAGICRLGALYAGASAQRQKLYAEFGSCLGMMFQLANDIAGVHPGVEGKTDLLLGRPTLPIVYARRQYAGNGKQPDGADEQTDVWTRGPVYLTWAAAEAYRCQARDLVDQLADDPAWRDALLELAPTLA